MPDILRVLLIEDNPFDAELLRINLTALRHPVFEVEAYECLKSGLEHLHKAEFDVALLDLSLPDGQGVGTVAMVRNVAPNIPIVVMTGLDDSATAVEAMRKGAQDYLIKGRVSPEDLGRVIRYAIERKRMDMERDEFISVASHELRSPVTVLKLGLENLQEGMFGRLTPKQREVIATSCRNVDRLNKIISDLLDISRLESGHVMMHKAATSLEPLAQLSLSESDLKLHKAITVKVDISPTLAPEIDADMMEEVFVNLFNNAARYATSEVRVSATTHNTDIEVCVFNDGPSIPKEEQDLVFQKFVQLKRKAGEGYKGTGLGLAICQRIVGLHHGKIWLEGNGDQGVTFHFTIPNSV